MKKGISDKDDSKKVCHMFDKLTYIVVKNFKKTLASYGNCVYNSARCDYALMWDVATHVGRELSRSMSDFKSGDKG